MDKIQRTKITTIIVDAGDVITRFNIDQFHTFIRTRGGSVEKDRTFFKKNKSIYDIGELTTEDFWNKYREETKVAATTKELTGVMRKIIGVDKETVHLLQELKKKNHLVLASNIDPVGYEETKKLLGDNLFDAEYISFRMGKLKSNPSFFTELLSKEGLKADNAIFIDDSEKNISSAKSVGIRGILFIGAKQLRATLESLHLL